LGDISACDGNRKAFNGLLPGSPDSAIRAAGVLCKRTELHFRARAAQKVWPVQVLVTDADEDNIGAKCFCSLKCHLHNRFEEF
jgi:hypothetical protein